MDGCAIKHNVNYNILMQKWQYGRNSTLDSAPLPAYTDTRLANAGTTQTKGGRAMNIMIRLNRASTKGEVRPSGCCGMP
jgi:hypothetical protein